MKMKRFFAVICLGFLVVVTDCQNAPDARVLEGVPESSTGGSSLYTINFHSDNTFNLVTSDATFIVCGKDKTVHVVKVGYNNGTAKVESDYEIPDTTCLDQEKK